MLSPPPTIKYDTFILNPDLTKYHYIQKGFKGVSICQSPKQIVLYNDLKCTRRQYVLRYYTTRTIHVAMSNTYNHMEILVSNTEK